MNLKLALIESNIEIIPLINLGIEYTLFCKNCHSWPIYRLKVSKLEEPHAVKCENSKYI